MPSVQDEHSSEDSQAFQSLLISDSLDDNADEHPDGLLCVILNIGLRASVTPITGQTMSIQSTDHVRLGLMLLTTGQFYLNCTLQEHRSELKHRSASNRTRHRSDVSRSSRRDSSTHRATMPLQHADPSEHSTASVLRHRRVRSRSHSYDSVFLRRHSRSSSRSRGKKKKLHRRGNTSTSSPSYRRSSSSSSRERARKWHKSKRRNTLVYVLLNVTNVRRNTRGRGVLLHLLLRRLQFSSDSLFFFSAEKFSQEEV